MALLLLVIAAWTAYRALLLGDRSSWQEDGLLENVQAALLLLSVLAGVHAAVAGRRADRALLLLLAWTFFGMTLRELDLERLKGVPPGLALLATGHGRTALLAGGYGVLGAFAAWELRRRGRTVLALLQPRSAGLLIAAGMLLLLGRFFETRTAVPYRVLLEELAELLAYGLILQLSLRMWLQSRRCRASPKAGGLGAAMEQPAALNAQGRHVSSR